MANLLKDYFTELLIYILLPSLGGGLVLQSENIMDSRFVRELLAVSVGSNQFLPLK